MEICERKLKEIIANQIEAQFDIERDVAKYVGSSRLSPIVKGSKEGFNSFGEFLQKVYDAEHNRGVDSRLTKEGMSEGTDSEGGFLVPEAFRAEILRISQEDAIIKPRATVYDIKTDTLKLARIVETTRSTSVYGNVIAYWTEEGGDATEKEPTFGSLELRVHKLLGYTNATSELVSDVSNLQNFLYECFGSAITFFEENAFWRGTGVGQPLGILNADCLKVVGKETTPAQPASTLVYPNLAKMYSVMLPEAQKRAIWVCSPSVLPELMQMAQKVLNQAGTDWVGGSAFWVSSISEAPSMTIFGRPLFVSEHLSALGTEGDICYVDPKGYVIANREELRIDSSIHIAFKSDKIYYRFVRRVDGQPMLNSTLTLKDGTECSPFITLAART